MSLVPKEKVCQYMEDNECLEKHLREADQKLAQLTESYKALKVFLIADIIC